MVSADSSGGNETSLNSGNSQKSSLYHCNFAVAKVIALESFMKIPNLTFPLANEDLKVWRFYWNVESISHEWPVTWSPTSRWR